LREAWEGAEAGREAGFSKTLPSHRREKAAAPGSPPSP